MLYNRHAKETLARQNKDYINRMTKYIPVRIKNIEQARSQFIGGEPAPPKFSVFPKHPVSSKSECNIQCQIEKIVEFELLPNNIDTNRGVINPFRKLTANAAQKHDLLNFHQIGSNLFENRIQAYILKEASVKVPMKQKRLQTFLTRKRTNKRRVASLEREMKQVQKCMRRKIAYAKKTGASLDVIGEQYIELPRALCDMDEMPRKGQKSLVTGFYRGRYENVIRI